MKKIIKWVINWIIILFGRKMNNAATVSKTERNTFPKYEAPPPPPPQKEVKQEVKTEPERVCDIHLRIAKDKENPVPPLPEPPAPKIIKEGAVPLRNAIKKSEPKAKIEVRSIRKSVPTVSPTHDELYSPLLAELMPKYGINTPLRQRHFLAQLLHESGSFRSVRENLNYSAKGLMKTWPNRFRTTNAQGMHVPNETALRLHRNPEAIANNVYANRMMNGDEASGDGWRFIGRGLIQITGRENYTACSRALFGDDRLLTQPEILEQPRYAVESACWFWQRKNINQHADRDDINMVTRVINGGVNGLKDRKQYFAQLSVSWV